MLKFDTDILVNLLVEEILHRDRLGAHNPDRTKSCTLHCRGVHVSTIAIMSFRKLYSTFCTCTSTLDFVETFQETSRSLYPSCHFSHLGTYAT